MHMYGIRKGRGILTEIHPICCANYKKSHNLNVRIITFILHYVVIKQFSLIRNAKWGKREADGVPLLIRKGACQKYLPL